MSDIHRMYLKLELGAVEIHPGAQTLAHHHAQSPNADRAAVQVALHAVQQALQEI